MTVVPGTVDIKLKNARNSALARAPSCTYSTHFRSTPTLHVSLSPSDHEVRRLLRTRTCCCDYEISRRLSSEGREKSDVGGKGCLILVRVTGSLLRWHVM